MPRKKKEEITKTKQKVATKKVAVKKEETVKPKVRKPRAKKEETKVDSKVKVTKKVATKKEETVKTKVRKPRAKKEETTNTKKVERKKRTTKPKNTTPRKKRQPATPRPKRRWGRIVRISTDSLDFLVDREVKILPKSTDSVLYAIVRWAGYEGLELPFHPTEIVEIVEPTYTVAETRVTPDNEILALERDY